MYFKIKDNILFRRYPQYGYLTDNSLFGYNFISKNNKIRAKYVSNSGAVMLSLLGKVPQHIDSIVDKLMSIYVNVVRNDIKQDVLDFFLYLTHEGYLSRGESYDDCNIFSDNKGISQQDISQVEYNNSGNIFIDSSNTNLKSVHVEVTSMCNEKCLHCYIPNDDKIRYMDSSLFYRVIQEARNMNAINVTITGGEPLLHQDIINFLLKCCELDMSVNLLTNLTLLNGHIIAEMAKIPLLSIQTSLYSMDPSVHDSITCMRGSFTKTKQAVLSLIEYGIPVQISCPIMKQNIDSFADVLSWGKSHDISVVFDYEIFAPYDHSNSNAGFRLSLSEVERALQYIEYDKHDLATLLKDAHEREHYSSEDSICSVCRHYICVSANGDAFPCAGWQTKILGNLYSNSLEYIWNCSDLTSYLRSIKWKDFPKCVECIDRGYCRVCMMMNANENNDDIFKISKHHCDVANTIHRVAKNKIDKLENI